MKKKTRIKSAKQALEESIALESVWSDESRLTQRILIYIAELLEALVKKRKARKPSKYQLFIRSATRKGLTLQQAAEQWSKKKQTP